MKSLIKECLLDSVALTCPEKKGAFENEPLSRRTVTRRVEDVAGNLELQLKNRAADLDYFSLVWMRIAMYVTLPSYSSSYVG